MGRTRSSRRLALALLAGGSLALLVTCVLLSFLPASPLGPGILPVTPEAGARMSSLCGRGPGFRVLDTRPTARGVLVTYSVRSFSPLGGGLVEYLGHAYMEREEDGIFWGNLGGGGCGGGPREPGDQLVNFDFGHAEHEALVYGYPLAAEVVTVETSFDNGQTLRDEVDDGAFTLQSGGLAQACEVRVLGADGKVLKTIKGPDLVPLLDEQGNPQPSRCK